MGKSNYSVNPCGDLCMNSRVHVSYLTSSDLILFHLNRTELHSASCPVEFSSDEMRWDKMG